MASGYPEGVFPGDREGKAAARALVYGSALERDGLKLFRERHHLVLGGGGGDIQFLLSAGVPAENIHVAETQVRVCTKLRKRFPSVAVHCEDALLLLTRSWGVSFSTVNLDLCNKLSDKVLAWATACLRAEGAKDATVSLTFLGCREGSPRVLRAIRLAVLANGLGYDGAYARCAAVFAHLQQFDDGVTRGNFIKYISRGRSLSGGAAHTPMCVGVFYKGERPGPVGEDVLVTRTSVSPVACRWVALGLQPEAVAAMLGVSVWEVRDWLIAGLKVKKRARMVYEKLTFEQFKVNLVEGKYRGRTGARRAVGKTSWDTAETAEAKRLVNKHFDDGDDSPVVIPGEKRSHVKKTAAPAFAAALCARALLLLKGPDADSWISLFEDLCRVGKSRRSTVRVLRVLQDLTEAQAS